MTTTALRVVGLFVAGVLLAGAGALIVPVRPAVVAVVLPSGRVVNAELARTAAERARGLMFRRSMPTDAGMLILFPESGRHAIWMKNCRLTLDVVWLDGRGVVVDVALGLAPCRVAPCAIRWPVQPASSILELNAGVAVRNGLDPGAVLRGASR